MTYPSAPEDPLEDLRNWLKKAQDLSMQGMYPETDQALQAADVVVDHLLAELPKFIAYKALEVSHHPIGGGNYELYAKVCVFLGNAVYEEWHSPSPSKELIQWDLRSLKDFIRFFREALP